MSSFTSAVEWPALVRFPLIDELLFVHSDKQLADANWRVENGLSPADGDGTELIDSRGSVFQPVENTVIKSLSWHATDKMYSARQVVELVQGHAALQGHCCVAKIGASSIKQAILLLEQLDD